MFFMNKNTSMLLAVAIILLTMSVSCTPQSPEKMASAVVPVSLPEPQKKAIDVRLFFSNTQKDPNMPDCSNVYAVGRSIPFTQAVARVSLERLLQGPTEDEKKKGYITSIPRGVLIRSLRIENKTAYADFNAQLESDTGGSCKVTAIIAQISQTLKQFDTIDSVVISIDGKTEDILQP